jgi:hypothetical protein
MYNIASNKQANIIENLFNDFREVSKFNGLNDVKKSVTNTTMLKAIVTLLQATSQSKNEIRDCVSKKKNGIFAGNKAVAGIISKAETIVDFIEQGNEIELENLTIGYDYLSQFNQDNLPSFTASSVYQAIKSLEKSIKTEQEKLGLIRDYFLENFKMLPSAREAIAPETFETEMQRATAQAEMVIEAKSKKAVEISLEDIKQAILQLNNNQLADINKLVTSLLSAPEKKVA